MLSRRDSPRGKLLQQFVCARITTMEGIDIGLFDFDRNNALYYFMLNADEHIYLRYGGRDSESADTYLNLKSLELALQQGLDLHRSYAATAADAPAATAAPAANANAAPAATGPEPLYPRDIPLLRQRTIARGNCVECHLIADYQNLHLEMDGNLDRPRDLFRSPDIKTIGIHLDVPKGLVVAEATAVAAEAGLQAADTITHLNGIRVRTFGDLQYHYDQVPRAATSLPLTVDRDGSAVALQIALPTRWWVTDIEFRHYTSDPQLLFSTEPLTRSERLELGLEPNGLASRVTSFDVFVDFAEPALAVGDIVVGVDGVREDAIANTPELFIKLNCEAGSSVDLSVLRDGETFTSRIRTEKQSFRK